MKPARFEYIRPETVADAVAFKGAYDGEASVLAGGQSLIPMLNFRLARPAALIDLNAVAGLEGLEVTDDTVRLGAMARQAVVERDARVTAACPLLAEALGRVAHPAIRNRGTIGGTIAHADASAELPTTLLALNGRVVAHGRDGERIVTADELFEFHLTTSLSPEEVITSIEFPTLPHVAGATFAEFARRHGDYALVGIAAVVVLDDADKISDARLAFSGIAPTPVRSTEAEVHLRGHAPDDSVFKQAADMATQCVDAVDEEQASVAFRQHLVRTLTASALATATARARAQREV